MHTTTTTLSSRYLGDFAMAMDKRIRHQNRLDVNGTLQVDAPQQKQRVTGARLGRLQRGR
jgi:hypothetical protein